MDVYPWGNPPGAEGTYSKGASNIRLDGNEGGKLKGSPLG